MRHKETWHVIHVCNCGGNNTKRKLQDEDKRCCRYTQSCRVMHTFIYVIITCGSFCFCVGHLMGLRCAWWFKVHTLGRGVVVFSANNCPAVRSGRRVVPGRGSVLVLSVEGEREVSIYTFKRLIQKKNSVS